MMDGHAPNVVEGLTLLHELGECWQSILALEVGAGLAAAQAHQRADAEPARCRAARIFGAAEALRETLGAPLLSMYQAHYQRGVAAIRAQFDEVTFAAAWAVGTDADAGAGHRRSTRCALRQRRAEPHRAVAARRGDSGRVERIQRGDESTPAWRERS